MRFGKIPRLSPRDARRAPAGEPAKRRRRRDPPLCVSEPPPFGHLGNSPYMDPITSLQNPRIKETVKLRDRKHREHRGQMVIDGAREIRRALACGVAIVEAFVCEPLCRSAESRHTLTALQEAGVPEIAVSEPVLRKVVFGDRVEGIVAVATLPKRSLAELKLPAAPLVAVLEGIEKPGNVGAIIRSADAAGISALIVADGRADLYNPNCIRASLGAVFALPVVAASGQAALAWIRREGLEIVCTRVDGARDYTHVDFRRPTAIVLGSEAGGLSDAWRGRRHGRSTADARRGR